MTPFPAAVPILFRGTMIRPLRRDMKTETRRQDVDRWTQKKPGDLLWTKETWASGDMLIRRVETDPATVIRYRADNTGRWFGENGDPNHWDPVDFAGYARPDKWKPSIFMSRWMSRDLLRITAIRVERVQEITEEGARAEGITSLSKDGGQTWKWGIPDRDGWPGTDDDGWPWDQWTRTAREAYEKLWRQINGNTWDDNPEIAVIQFQRETRT